MKKLVLIMGLLSLSTLSYAACMGPFCWDDQGGYIGGVINDGNGAGVPQATSTAIGALTPRTVGQEVYCSNCSSAYNAAGTLPGLLCVSTGTTRGAYMIYGSSLTAITGCK